MMAQPSRTSSPAFPISLLPRVSGAIKPGAPGWISDARFVIVFTDDSRRRRDLLSLLLRTRPGAALLRVSPQVPIPGQGHVWCWSRGRQHRVRGNQL